MPLDLAPLDPNAFLRFFWKRERGVGRPPSWREWCLKVGIDPKVGRKEIVRWAARVRMWQRREIYEQVREVATMRAKMGVKF